jgi:hypothetical protein
LHRDRGKELYSLEGVRQKIRVELPCYAAVSWKCLSAIKELHKQHKQDAVPVKGQCRKQQPEV